MATLRDRPYTQFNFLVDLGNGVTEGPRAGFQEVSGIGMEVTVSEYAMAVMRDRPYVNSNFLVDLGGEDSRSVSAGFAEVIFPEFTINSADRRLADSMRSQGGDATPAHDASRLILKRGLIGTLDLYSWWTNAHPGKTPQRRTVKVELLAEDHSTVVLTWHFRNAYPVSLSYSPLRAMEGGIVMETIELAFDGMEMS